MIWVLRVYLGLMLGCTGLMVLRGYLRPETPSECCPTCNVPLLWDSEGENICTRCGVSRA